MKQKGFTIPELLVAVFVFLVIMGGAMNLLVAGIGAQRKSLVAQEVMDQTSFLAEYMSRRLRGAQKDLVPTCLSGRGLNFEVSLNGVDWLAEGSGNRVRFINNGGQCQEFRLAGARIEEVFWAGGEITSQAFITSDNLSTAAMNFVVLGASQDDNQQPRVSFVLDIQGGEALYQVRTQLQTTISQRKVDVPN